MQAGPGGTGGFVDLKVILTEESITSGPDVTELLSGSNLIISHPVRSTP